MFPFLYGYFLLFHILLFLLVGHSISIVSLGVVLEIGVLFHLGVLTGLRQATTIDVTSVNVYRVRGWMIGAAFTLFFLMRLQKVGGFGQALLAGNAQGFLLQNAIDRYAGVETSTLDNIGTLLFLAVSALAGAWFGCDEKRRHQIIVAIAYLTAIIVQSLDLSRASTVLGIMLLFCFLLYNRRLEFYRRGWSWASRLVAIAFGMAFAIFAFGQYGRVFEERDAVSITLDRANNLFVAGHYAFLTWLDEAGLHADGSGTGMFGAVAKLFGQKFVQGNYDPIDTPFGSTNIFLWYRGAIQDFGPFFGIYDFVCGYATVAMANRNPGRIETLFCMFGVQLILFPFYSPLYFTVFFTPFVMIVLFLPQGRLTPVSPDVLEGDADGPAIVSRAAGV